MDSIRKRRSIRQYDGRPLSEERIEYLLKMGMQAPSAHNQRPWQFLVFTDTNVLTEISEFHPYGKMLKDVGVVILVCGDFNRSNDTDFWQQDCAAVTQNILTAATEINLGSIWVGMYPKVNLTSWAIERFDLPEGIIPFALIGVGYALEEKEPRDYFDTTRVHYNKW